MLHLVRLFVVLQGCEAAVKDRDGCTPLYCAAAWNRAEAVRRLEQLGCPSWARSEEGRTAVHVAAEQGWTALIELLVKHLKNKVTAFEWTIVIKVLLHHLTDNLKPFPFSISLCM